MMLYVPVEPRNSNKPTGLPAAVDKHKGVHKAKEKISLKFKFFQRIMPAVFSLTVHNREFFGPRILSVIYLTCIILGIANSSVLKPRNLEFLAQTAKISETPAGAEPKGGEKFGVQAKPMLGGMNVNFLF